METKSKSGEYVAPEINVIEIKSLGVLCTSGTGTDQYGEGDTSGWF